MHATSGGPERRRLHGPDPRLPIVEHVAVEASAAERGAIERLAERLRRQEPALDSTEPFGAGVRVGIAPTPALHVQDTAAVQLAGRGSPSHLEYRAFALAAGGDAVALSMPRVPAFESHYRETLGLGRVEALHVPPLDPTASLSMRCMHDPSTLARLSRLAGEGGGLTVHPYIGSGGVWALAGAVADRARTTVHVAAPPPGVARRVNDKLWFARQVAGLLGERAAPPSREVLNLSTLAGCVRDLAREHDRIGLKLPSAAGGEGNLVVEAAPLRGLPLRALRDALRRLIAPLGWRQPFPMQVCVWEAPLVTSPSVQLWIPEAEEAPPRVEGIFEQQVSGTTGVFVGAVPAVIPGGWTERLAREAFLLGALFQRLGYFGRCSFDAIVVGSSFDDAVLHWVECNGRWGGTSLPMTLVNRLTGDWARTPFVAFNPEGVPGLDFTEAIERTRDLLFRPGAASGLLYLSPGWADSCEGIGCVAVGGSLAEARRLADEASARLRD